MGGTRAGLAGCWGGEVENSRSVRIIKSGGVFGGERGRQFLALFGQREVRKISASNKRTARRDRKRNAP
jgi:hypothetical protein